MKKYISLTSIFDNQEILYLTLCSLISQIKDIDTIFVFLSEEPYLQDSGFKNKIITNENLLNLLNIHEKIEVKWVENTGSFRKILNILKCKFNEDCLIIYLDDDIIYEKTFIERILTNHRNNNCCINNRGFSMNFHKTWGYQERKNLIQKNIHNYHTAKGGVLINPLYFHKTEDIIFNYKIIKETCPYSDDIWINFMRICNNVECFLDNYKFYEKELANMKKSLYYNYNSMLKDKQIKASMNKLIELGYLKI